MMEIMEMIKEGVEMYILWSAWPYGQAGRKIYIFYAFPFQLWLRG